ncbi:hypothetical protein [Streptomyces armeniacus]|uniref:hypothetical protein n=1 Tax=Streptomyces armeniacus TaxID=83291 RepID=UPI001AD8319B|nr:hypothetical protein [Streptomyces armeniacus]
MTALRWMLGTAGAVLLGTGGWLLVTETREDTVPQVLLWLAGAVAVHDGLLVPLVLLAGAALRWAHGRRRGDASRNAPEGGLRSGYGVLRGAFVVGGCLTLIALPVLLRQGQGRNPTALPLDYAANWRLLLAVTLAVTLVLLAARAPAYRARLASGCRALGALLAVPVRAVRRRVRGRARRR